MLLCVLQWGCGLQRTESAESSDLKAYTNKIKSLVKYY